MTFKKRVLVNGLPDFESRKNLVENICETHCGYFGACLGSYLSVALNGRVLRYVELLLCSQRSTSHDFAILMKKCMNDLQKESFGEWPF